MIYDNYYIERLTMLSQDNDKLHQKIINDTMLSPREAALYLQLCHSYLEDEKLKKQFINILGNNQQPRKLTEEEKELQEKIYQDIFAGMQKAVNEYNNFLNNRKNKKA